MSGWKKLASAAAAAGGGLNVEDVFSTHLWEGDASNPRTITNGIDLSGEGGLTVIKRRDGGTQNWGWWDTERGPDSFIKSNDGSAENTTADKDLTDFNSDGFTLGANHNLDVNSSGGDFCSWSFRKAPRFFDCVEYTGNGTAGRTISHNLGCEVGMMIVKRTDSTDSWYVYHRDMNSTAPEDYYMRFDTYFGTDYTDVWNNTAPTSTNFTLGSSTKVNASGGTYVAYLFAHNDDDGEFGPNGDADIIKCGSYTGNGSGDGPEINLGFEPQFLIVKGVGSNYWEVMDTMRGMPVQYSGSYTRHLRTSESAAELDQFQVNPSQTGFKIFDSASQINTNGRTYIYIAIRRGLMGIPEDATNVFAIDQGDSGGSSDVPEFDAGFPVDMGINKGTTTSNWQLHSRLTDEKVMYVNYNEPEGNAVPSFDFSDGYYGSDKSSTYYAWMWRRASSYFDVIPFTSGTSSNRRLDHSLGVAPEMVWVKRRDAYRNWYVYHKDLGDASYGARDYRMYLNSGQAKAGPTINMWGTSDPTDTDFGLNENDVIGANQSRCIAYLFASAAGVSKVGSYTGNGSSQTIDCGFSSGARFVLIKQVDGTADWALFDTERGIVAGDDALLRFNGTNAQSTALGDIIDPHSSGFIVNAAGGTMTNNNGSPYIFYAIA